MLGKHLIKSWSSTQGLVSLSSGEAEYYGVVKAAGIGLGYQALLRDLGVRVPLRTWTDSTASMGICGRSGLGKLRHIDTQCLWLQQKVRSGAVVLRKVKGTENPADLFTKHLTSAPCVEALLRLFGCEYRGGRPNAPELRHGAGRQPGSQLSIAEVALERGRAADRQVRELMAVDGQEFPKTWWDGEAVPEAWSYDQRRLPHLQAEEHKLFPKATAVADAGDEDPAERCILEDRWHREHSSYKLAEERRLGRGRADDHE